MLGTIFRRLPAALITLLLFPVIASEYFKAETGREYGIGIGKKLALLVRMVRTNFRVVSATTFITHVLMAAEILKVPRETRGVIVECGAYKGGSTTNLSLIAAAVGRELHVFDSFAGLPKPSDVDAGHVLLGSQEVRTYEEGDYAGSLEEVTRAVTSFGAIDVCTFHVGFFNATLPAFDQPVVLAFLDVDLVSSTETCLVHLWPKLQSGCFLFSDEAQHHEIGQLFYDREWWSTKLNEQPPGLVGAGNGLGIFLGPRGFHSSLGYTIKIDHDDLPTLPG
jgi:O-methyltransferase